jgi:DNA-binding response OmpR family regulator
MRHAGVPLPAKQLYREVWADEHLPDTAERTLQAHVARLRRAVEVDPARPARIVTSKAPDGEPCYRFEPPAEWCLLEPIDEE